MKRKSVIIPTSNNTSIIKDRLLINDKGMILEGEQDELYVRLGSEFAGVTGVIDSKTELVKQHHVQRIVDNELAAYDLERSIFFAPDFSTMNYNNVTDIYLSSFINKEYPILSGDENEKYFELKLDGIEYIEYLFKCSIQITQGHPEFIDIEYEDGTIKKEKVNYNSASISIPFYALRSAGNNSPYFNIKIYAGEKGSTQNINIIISHINLFTYHKSVIKNKYSHYVDCEVYSGFEKRKHDIFGTILYSNKNNHFLFTQNNIIKKYIEKTNQFSHSIWIKASLEDQYTSGKVHIYNVGNLDNVYYDVTSGNIVIAMYKSNNQIAKSVYFLKDQLFDNKWHNIITSSYFYKLEFDDDINYIVHKDIYFDGVLIGNYELSDSTLEFLLIEHTNISTYTNFPLFTNPFVGEIANILMLNTHINEQEALYLYKSKGFPFSRLFIEQENEIQNNVLQEISQKIDEHKRVLSQIEVLISEKMQELSNISKDAIIKASGQIGEIRYFLSKNFTYGFLYANGDSFIPELYPEFYQFWMDNFNDPKKKNYLGFDSFGYPRLPDLRGVVLRAVDDNIGRGAVNEVLEFQGDAIRNIVAAAGFSSGNRITWSNGAFYHNYGGDEASWKSQSKWNTNSLSFDASRVVPTADENRVKSKGVFPFIKVI